MQGPWGGSLGALPLKLGESKCIEHLFFLNKRKLFPPEL